MGTPLVGIVMGSASDRETLEKAEDVLREFGVAYEARVMSAHRTPELVQQYATAAAGRGVKVVIAAAGGAAHLAGTVAAHTTLPVIGLPVPTDLAGGLDSLLSMVQMPGDVPVATVGANTGGARNAGILAVEILAVADERLRAKLVAFKQRLRDKIAARDAAFQETLRGERQRT